MGSKKSLCVLWKVHRLTMWRRWRTSLILVIIAAVSAFSIMSLNTLILRQQAAMEQTVANTSIRCVVTDPKGMSSDSLGMFSAYVDMLTGKRHSEGCYLDQYVKDVCATASIPINSPSDFILRKILSLDSDKALASIEGARVQFLDGWDENAFHGELNVCMIPDTLITNENEGQFITIEFQDGSNKELQIIGVVENGPSNVIYCPFYLQQTDTTHEVFRVDTCSFIIRDNSRLEESRNVVYQEFLEPKLSNQDDGIHFAVLIQDEIYRNTVEEIEANLNTLQIMLPILLGLCFGISFLSGYLVTRGRTKEFAIMRCIGMSRYRIMLLLIGELTMLSLVGILVGFLGGSIFDGAFSSDTLGKILFMAGIFIGGTAVAALRVTSVNVMKLMKVED